jgi:hypothetical protein
MSDMKREYTGRSATCLGCVCDGQLCRASNCTITKSEYLTSEYLLIVSPRHTPESPEVVLYLN